jgi:alcohol dehydrogenase class IV
VPHLVSQPGAARQLGQHVSAHLPHARRATIVTDPGFLRTGLVEAPARDLEKHKLAVQVYSEVMADPPEHVVLNAVDFARQHRVDIVIGIGGGSSMDFAGQAFSNSPVAAVHALAYPIGGIFHVPHGLSNSLVLPHVLRFNMPAALDHYAEIAGIKAPHVEGSPEARARALIVAAQQIAKITRHRDDAAAGGDRRSRSGPLGGGRDEADPPARQ